MREVAQDQAAFANRPATRSEANLEPNAKRSIGPKLLAAAAPTK